MPKLRDKLRSTSSQPPRLLLAAALVLSSAWVAAAQQTFDLPSPSATTTLTFPEAVAGPGDTNTAGNPASNSPNPTPTPTAAAPVASGVTIPLASPSTAGTIEIEQENGLVSLIVRDAPLRRVMALLADAHQLNLVFASPTDVAVTAAFDRIPLDHAIDSLLSAYGFTWTRSDDVVYVTPISNQAALPARVQGRRVAVLELDFAAAADIDPSVKGLLSPVGKSWVLETNNADNRRTKEAIIVEDLEANLHRIEQFVADADQPPRQVLIEAHLLEVELDREERAGVNLSSLARLSGSRLTAAAAGFASNTASPAFLIESTGGDLGLLVEALISTTDAKTLAKPRLLAVNGQQARIQIGEQLGFRITTTTQTSTLESVDFINVGVVLTVTPRITRDGRVLMRIRPEVSSGSVNPITGLPEEETTEVETDVLLADGQGMVIGGLIQERDSVNISRVPLLSKIPYAGFLFERKENQKQRSELIVALKPHVLPYSPIEQDRNEAELARVNDPLVYGPLHRYPRPYEARLPQTLNEENKPRILRTGESLSSRGAATNPECATEVGEFVARRLPPVTPSVEEPIVQPSAIQPADHETALARPKLLY